MKLATILSKIDPSTTDVRFLETCDFYNTPPIHITTMNIDALYKDWWDEALNCPENGTFIYGVTFCTDDGKMYMLDNTGYQDFEFQTLMEEFKKSFYSAN